MPRTILSILAISLSLGVPTPPLAAQVEDDVPQTSHRHLGGFRFGVTAFTGDVAALRQQAGMDPIMMQIGFQTERQVLTGPSGTQALIELLQLYGGIGQGELNVSYAALAGLRLGSGVELGAGPSLSFNFDQSDATTAMIVAAGATLPAGEMYVPVNVAVSMAPGGPRLTALIGWMVE